MLWRTKVSKSAKVPLDLTGDCVSAVCMRPGSLIGLPAPSGHPLPCHPSRNATDGAAMRWLLIGYMFLFIDRPFEVWPWLGDLHVERIYMLLHDRRLGRSTPTSGGCRTRSTPRTPRFAHRGARRAGP